jgi:hypothetical protein
MLDQVRTYPHDLVQNGPRHRAEAMPANLDGFHSKKPGHLGVRTDTDHFEIIGVDENGKKSLRDFL